MPTPPVSAVSALEAARRLIEKPSNAVMGGDHTGIWIREDDVLAVARAYIKACEALEPFAKIELSSMYDDADNEAYTLLLHHGDGDLKRSDFLRARAALSCSAPPPETGGSIAPTPPSPAPPEDKQDADTNL